MAVLEGKFHPFKVSRGAAIWKTELNKLARLLKDGVTSGKGVGEKELLAWFGENANRMALLAYATSNVVPTHVAREVIIGGFRADFAWICKEPNASPIVCFVEIEGALPTTLFRKKKKGRIEPYIGDKFLDGFSQLVDWCSFGRALAETHPLVGDVLNNDTRAISYRYSLIAGIDDFMQNASLHRRLMWWHDNIKLGHGTETLTFTALVNQGRRNLQFAQQIN